MGNTCCADNSDGKDGPSKIPAQSKEIKILEIDTEPEKFGQKVNEAFFKLTDTVKELVRKYNLYRFDQSAPELKGLENLPVKRAATEDFQYEGNFMGSRLKGKGHLLTKEGDLFVCTFDDGLAKGVGAVYYASGNYFFGRMNFGEMQDGKLIFADGAIYIGSFKNGKRHGRGTFEYKDKSKYEGSWQNDLEHGIGRLIYDGVWENGKRQATVQPPPVQVVAEPKPSDKKEPVREPEPRAPESKPHPDAGDKSKQPVPADPTKQPATGDTTPPAPEPIRA